MAIGATAGLAMPMLLALHVENEPAEIAQAPAATAPAPPIPAEMSWVSYLVLTGMITLIVGGLGWCFYRAIKAAGGGEEAPEQLAENDE